MSSRHQSGPLRSIDRGTEWKRTSPEVCRQGKVSLRHQGRLYSIGVGRTHARTHVILLVQDLDIRVVHAATGELLRALTLDTSRYYQPTGRPPGPSS